MSLYKLRHSVTGLAAALAMSLAGCSAGARRDVSPSEESMPPGVALATFDSLWSIVRNTYVDTAFVSRRWMAVRDSLRPRAKSVSTRSELSLLLDETLKQIPESHFYIIPAAVASTDADSRSTDGKGMTGLALRIVGDDALVWRVESGSPAAAAGIRPGQRVRKAGEKTVQASLRKIRAMPEAARQRAMSDLLHKLNGELTPPVGDSVRVELAAAGGGRTIVRTLVAVPASGRISQYGSLPPIAGLVRSSRLPAVNSGTCIGLISFNIWLPALVADIERAVDSVRTCSGVVMDLRGNPGGVGAMVMGIGGYFVDSVRSLGTMRMRQLSLNFVINPRRSRERSGLRPVIP